MGEGIFDFGCLIFNYWRTPAAGGAARGIFDFECLIFNYLYLVA
jgi:hypothetical protein